MGVLADIAKISSDSTAQATALGALQAAQATETSAQAAYDAFGGTISADDQQLSTDLQALPSPVFVTNADGSISVYSYSASPPGFTILTAQPAT
jgi:hypothetical protein